MHCLLLMMSNFNAEVTRHQKQNSALYPILKKLCNVFALWHLSQEMRYLLEDGYMTGDHARWLESLLREQTRELRNDAVSLVDAFGFPDWLIRSAIGKRDGDIYRNYFDAVTASKHQQLTDAGKPTYWERYIKPLTNPITSSSASS